ncbi:MAG: response regulator [Gammaproteobacteria bacterium]|nr:response regulator [Gammaproteobacteria bacterium]
MPELSIIDDELQIAEILAEVGEMAGYKVSIFTEARKFLSEHARHGHKEPDVIFLDLTMPDIDGIEVITELGNRKSKAILVLMSGFDMDLLQSAQQLAQEYGLNAIESFTKPMDIDHVIQLLENLKSTL